MYHHFSSVYDQLMEDAPYDDWLDYTRRYVKPGSEILDVACGTGTFTLLLAEEGYQVSGVDLSTDMLTIADTKSRLKNLRIPFLHQDMRKLDGFFDLDAVLLFCDGLNYLQGQADVRATFDAVFQSLKSGGEFLFDVHSPYKIEEVFHHQMYGENGEDISYMWFSEEGDEPLSVNHIITFFRKREDGTYERFDEEHYQRTFSPDVYFDLLYKTGFKDIDITASFGNEPVKEETERIFFRAVKP
ncbi:class I SAM-dependent DNA methyltransferase [Salisediminibacterium beveridgei]|uniref:Putative methyltransferase n=1 Tax=Salisediminibacterium beveridgei TaxID=632773 RepID=A0A1D7QUC1_9BACI|nr:class I SAM-dependent methyltransferase [Salisediminibacterium beveridgei]AOM82568.1 putative methyltransferase [Salisediminibacterium beveridgei]